MLSVVVPAYNEAEGIEIFHRDLLLPGLKACGDSFEIIYVNDGSTDKTLDRIKALAKKDPRVRVVGLSKNFGKEIATTAGISAAKGDAIIILDADGQHPPELIKDFVAKWRKGAQVVVGIRASNQQEGAVKKWGSKFFYGLFNKYSGAQIVPRSTDFRLIDKVVRQEFLRCSERNRITRGLIDWLGFNREYIEFNSPARLAGEASYSNSKLIKLALNSFVSLSLKPLEILAGIGVGITLLALLSGVFVLIEQVILSDPLGLHFTGSAMLGILITFLVGLVMTSQGVVAIYLAHIHAQTQGRPLFIVNPADSVNYE